MKLCYMLCVVLVQLSAVVVLAINDEAMQQAITETVNNNTTGTFCLKAKVTGKMGVCVYIHKDQATWEDAQHTCTSWGGHLPEDQRYHSDIFNRQTVEETNVAFLTTQIRFPDGTWLGGRMLPIEEHSSLEPKPTRSDIDNICNLRSRPTPPPPRPEPTCDEQQDIKCGTMHSSNRKTELSRCNCFQPRPYICVTSKDKHTQYCPNGFNKCTESSFCYIRGDPNSNWFRANQQCGDHGAELPGIENEGLGNITALMDCARLDDIWTSDSDAVWIWNSTGRIIKHTNWEPGQPECPPMDCLKMETNGEWSVVDCKMKSNFMCIKRNAACDDGCEVIPYLDSSKAVLDDQSVGINSNSNQDGRQQPSRQSLSTCQEVVIGVVIALSAVVIIFIILLVILLHQNRKYKEKLISMTGGSQSDMKGAGGPGDTTHNNAYVEED